MAKTRRNSRRNMRRKNSRRNSRRNNMGMNMMGGNLGPTRSEMESLNYRLGINSTNMNAARERRERFELAKQGIAYNARRSARRSTRRH